MTPRKPLTADLLLEHRGFLHGLARSLVFDEQRAEDVVQDTFAAALARPPPSPVRLRAWLSTVTRNLALRSRRTEGRLRRRELQAARLESTVATADVAARVEIQRRLADAVAALDEPGRSAIVWRYFDGLAPREIARQEGVSVRTIESRLRRAREALRKHLDTLHDGQRGVWCAALGPLLGLDLSSAASSATSSSAVGATAASTTSATAGAGLTAAAAVGATLVSTKLILGSAALGIAAAFFAGRHLAPAPSAPVVDERPVAEAPKDAAGPVLHTDAEAAMRTMKNSVEEAQRKTAELQEANDELRAELAAAREAAPQDAGPGAYLPEAYKTTVGKMSWPEAGEAAAKMVPLLRQLAEDFVGGKAVSQDIGLEIFKWNQKLQEVAVVAIADKVPGAASNSAFTHPSVSINLIHSTLVEAKQSLSNSQIESLRKLGDRYIEDDQRRTAGYNDETFELQKIIDECALKDGMFGAIDAVLTEAQREVLHPESIRGRLGIDLFSSGTIWYGICKAANYTTRDELVAAFSRRHRMPDSLSERDRAAVETAAKEWAAGFSAEFEQASLDALGQTSRREAAGGNLAGWQRIAQAREAAIRHLAFYKAVYEVVRAQDPALAAKVRGNQRVLIPLKQPQ